MTISLTIEQEDIDAAIKWSKLYDARELFSESCIIARTITRQLSAKYVTVGWSTVGIDGKTYMQGDAAKEITHLSSVHWNSIKAGTKVTLRLIGNSA